MTNFSRQQRFCCKRSARAFKAAVAVDVLCPYLNVRCVTLTGFFFLDEVEAGLDSLEQRLLRLNTVTLKEPH